MWLQDAADFFKMLAGDNMWHANMYICHVHHAFLQVAVACEELAAEWHEWAGGAVSLLRKESQAAGSCSSVGSSTFERRAACQNLRGLVLSSWEKSTTSR